MVLPNPESEHVHFFTEDCSFDLKEKDAARSGICRIVLDHSFLLGEINVIFCSDEYLLQMNRDYLGHDYYTDILTFPIGQEPLCGDLFISIDRVQDYAKHNNISLPEEVLRVIFHGVLHLVGYNDHNKTQKALMREKEDEYLRLSKV